MTKKIKLKLFQSCCSKDPSSLPYDPLLSRSVHGHVRHLPASSRCSSIRSHMSFAVAPMGCVSSRLCCTVTSDGRAGEVPDELAENFFHWLKEEDWLVVAKLRHKDDESAPRRKIYLDSAPFFPWLVLPQNIEDGSLETISPRSLKHKRNSIEFDNDVFSMTPPRLSRFQWMIPFAVEGKVRESFAVVKKSDDPYEDFKESMVEMVVEKGMVEEDDLEKLLHCFLSLNSKDHHGVIIRAFTEVWRSVFAPRSSSTFASISAYLQ